MCAFRLLCVRLVCRLFVYGLLLLVVVACGCCVFCGFVGVVLLTNILVWFRLLFVRLVCCLFMCCLFLLVVVSLFCCFVCVVVLTKTFVCVSILVCCVCMLFVGL